MSSNIPNIGMVLSLNNVIDGTVIFIFKRERQ